MKNNRHILLVVLMALISIVALPVMASTISLSVVGSSDLSDLFDKLNVDGVMNGLPGWGAKSFPESATMFLLGVSLAGLAGVSRRKSKL